ncbi:MAG: hypothetical protein AAGN15_13360 [Cyanobacteria bacterium J06581_3]
MSISELNQFMTYVLDGWMLFSAGFISIGFVSFVSKRIQEDLEAEALALTQAEKETVDNIAVEKAVEEVANVEEVTEAARLEEVAAVSEQLAKNKSKQSDTSSVSVST